MSLTLYREYNNDPIAVLEPAKIAGGPYRFVIDSEIMSPHFNGDPPTPDRGFRMTKMYGLDLLNYTGIWRNAPYINEEQYNTAFSSVWTLPEPEDIVDESVWQEQATPKEIYVDGGTKFVCYWYCFSYSNGQSLLHRTATLKIVQILTLTKFDEETGDPVWEYVTGEFANNYFSASYWYDQDTNSRVDICLAEASLQPRDRSSGDSLAAKQGYMLMLGFYGLQEKIEIDPTKPEGEQEIHIPYMGYSHPMGILAFDKEYITGSKGDQPEINRKTKNTKKGGSGSGAWTNRSNGERMNISERRNAFSFCSKNGDGLTCYRLGNSDFLHYILNQTYELGIVKDNSYVRSALVSAYLLPYCPDIESPTFTRFQTYVQVANLTLGEERPESKEVVLTNLSGKYGCIYDLSGNGWDDFHDWETRFELYLPFVGSVNIDARAIAQSQIYVIYTINVYNGNIVYWVYTKCLDSPTDRLYGIYSGNCAIEIPLMGAGESGSVLGKITNTVSGIATGVSSIASGNPVAAAAGLVNGASQIIDSLVPSYHVDKSGTIDTNSSTQSPYRISLKITAPRPIRLGENSIETPVKGKPSYFNCTIEDLPSGLNVISDINLDTVTASDAEKDAIRQILKGGVFV